MSTEATLYSPTPPETAKYQVIAWVIHFSILFVTYLIDYTLRDFGDPMSEGINDNVFAILLLGSLVTFLAMTFIGTRYIRYLFVREVLFIGHLASCILITFIWMIFYSMGILGETI